MPHFCSAPDSEAPSAEHKASCPVCWLVATESTEHNRWQDTPRPFAIEPPLLRKAGDYRACGFAAGERFTFGVTLFDRALNLFPYLVAALPTMGAVGLGIPVSENGDARQRKRRGRFVLRRIDAVNAMTKTVKTVLIDGETTVLMPDIPVVEQDILCRSQEMMPQLEKGRQVQLCYHTPTRIIEEKKLVREPRMGPLFRRLLERLDALRGEFAGCPPVPERKRLCALADEVRLIADQTQWVEVKSSSQRQNRTMYISGFVGPVAYDATPDIWRTLLPYLLWGQVLHVGKNATKGNGWYEIDFVPGR